jgi:exodeoxyribonuclease V beta subunit
VRLARAALAARTLDFSIAELLHLATDDEAFDQRCDQLRQLNTVWAGQGVLSMLRQTLHLLELPARWLAAAGGERRLTNFLHLAELLQAASTQLDGEQALIRWLAGQRGGLAAGGDEQIVRLESDADLVKVITVHKSKGLEYPLVFLPFASGFRPVTKARTLFVKPTEADGSRRLQLQPDSAQIAAADKERQREDLRLLYVATTRARHALWVGLAALKVGNSAACVWPGSAIGYLLGGGVSTEAGALAAHVAARVQPCGHIVLRPAWTSGPGSGQAGDEVPCTLLQASDAPPALRELLPYAASFERRWSVGSYSVLVRSLSAAGSGSASHAAVRDDELPAAAEQAAEKTAGQTTGKTTGKPAAPAIPEPSSGPADGAPWHHFPRGAMPGNFLHEQLEWLAGEGFAIETSAELQQQLMRRCERQGWAARGPHLLDWLSQLLKTALPPLGVALRDIAHPVPELEFWMPSSGLQAGAVDALCRQHLLGGRERPALPERELRGMLMGFADLVFEHAGRYWVLDYKSNHLGASDADYDEENLEAAMAVHRYDVQAALYLQALHRLLQSRLGAGYEPTRHLGGAIYHFLRGFRGPAGGCYVVPAEPALLIGLDALLGNNAEAA